MLPARRSRLALLALLCGAGACGGDVTSVTSEWVTQANLRFVSPNPIPYDVLFVIDGSPSMLDEQDRLADNLDRFIQSVVGIGDVRFGVVSMDLGSEASSACLRGPASQAPFIDWTVSPEVAIQRFEERVRIGTEGSEAEQGIEAALLALENTDCNAGFVRPSSRLVLIFISDEDACGGLGCRDEEIEAQLDRLERIHPLMNVRAAAIVGSVDGEPMACRMDEAGTATSSCTPSGAEPIASGPNECSAAAGDGYLRFVEALEQRAGELGEGQPGCSSIDSVYAACVVDSICARDFSDSLRAIVLEPVIISSAALQPCAVYPPGVAIHKNGEPLVNGLDFSIRPDGCSVVFLGPNAPGYDDLMEIFFVIDTGP